MVSAQAAFDRILEALKPDLTAGGFERVEARDHLESFGSQRATFSDGRRFVRLTWDAKERWFVLEGDNQPQFRPKSGEIVWLDLTLQRLDQQEADGKWVADVVDEITEAFREFTL